MDVAVPNSFLNVPLDSLLCGWLDRYTTLLDRRLELLRY